MEQMSVSPVLTIADTPKAAFRLVPVRRQDWPLLGYKVLNDYHFDIVLPFGCRSSPFLFCLFSSAVHWILEKCTGHKNILHYVDDFLISGHDECGRVINEMRRICEEFGVSLATEKAEGPSTVLVFLGIQLDSVAQTLSLPQPEIHEITQLIATWSDASSISRTELQSLIGKLQFAAKCLYTDASATRGMSGYFRGQWFQSEWPDWVLQKKTVHKYLEMLSAVYAWENLGSSNSAVLDLKRRMTTIAAQNNSTFTLKHVSGVDNSIVDSLSRFQNKRFRQLAPDTAADPVPLPKILTELQETYDRLYV
ncbi:hypothetical protein RvY_10871 [Ramazzottius varieornatus]|uniref:Reverse transcriptase domain-containing protein n=1 Tax=Ramazzottius varieornatus TaxID=947166 RepID=A0A1D1VG90_RAMVA|nr:hypothetical protein RvY_10871 [Ramazzottius varieornatus]